jgi:hypothetical protein
MANRERLDCAKLTTCPCTHKWPFSLFCPGLLKCKLCYCYNIIGRVDKPHTVIIKTISEVSTLGWPDAQG